MSISGFRMENTHQCQQCGMKFYNAQQLVNHVKKFCTSAGLNSLEGLAKYQNTSNFSKKLKNYGAHSLGSMKYQPIYNPTQLAKQAKDVQLHREQLAINRPYSNTNSQIHTYQQNFRKKNETQLGGYQRSIVRKFDMPQNINPRAAFGQRILAGSQVSIKSLGNFTKNNPKPNYPTQSNIKVDNLDNNYYSPPSLPLPSPFAKHAGPSVLDKSTSSIAKMSLSQKRNYASDKLVQLDNIASLYDQSGGMSMDFRKNLQKMKKFYQKMLQDEQKFGDYQSSRAQTPISRLREFDKDEKKNQRGQKKQPQDILDKQFATKLSGKKSRAQNQTQKNRKFTNSQQNVPYNHNNPYTPNYPNQFPAQQYNPYPQPQIIMMPPYPPQQIQQPNNDTSEQIKYFQKMIELKNQENKKLMQMLLETKRQKNQSQIKDNIEHIRQSRISEIRNGNINQNNIYHMETPMGVLPSSQQRILLALQRQQLDQLRLLSSLPPQLQQIKMQSVMKIIQQRTQIQKQILQQKVRRLEQQQTNHLYLQQAKLSKDQWANQERKKLIGHQMDSIIGELQRKVNGEDSQGDEQNGQNQQDYSENGDGQ